MERCSFSLQITQKIHCLWLQCLSCLDDPVHKLCNAHYFFLASRLLAVSLSPDILTRKRQGESEVDWPVTLLFLYLWSYQRLKLFVEGRSSSLIHASSSPHWHGMPNTQEPFQSVLTGLKTYFQMIPSSGRRSSLLKSTEFWVLLVFRAVIQPVNVTWPYLKMTPLRWSPGFEDSHWWLKSQHPAALPFCAQASLGLGL